MEFFINHYRQIKVCHTLLNLVQVDREIEEINDVASLLTKVSFEYRDRGEDGASRSVEAEHVSEEDGEAVIERNTSSLLSGDGKEENIQVSKAFMVGGVDHIRLSGKKLECGGRNGIRWIVLLAGRVIWFLILV